MSDSNDQGSMTVNGPSSDPGSESPRGNGGGSGGGNSGSGNGAGVANVVWGSGSITETIGNVTMTFEGTHAIGTGTFPITGSNLHPSSGNGGNDTTFHPSNGKNIKETNPTITFKPDTPAAAQKRGYTQDTYLVAFPTLTIGVTVKNGDPNTASGTLFGGYHGTSERPDQIVKQHIPRAVDLVKVFLDYQKSVQLTIDFTKELTQRLGDRAGKMANDLANNAVGKTIRNYDQAMAAFEQARAGLYGKMSAADRAAISNALASLDQSIMSQRLLTYSKALGLVSDAMTYGDLVNEIRKALDTGQWGTVMVKAEAIAAGKVATAVVAFTFGIMTATPMGILGFALLSALTSSLVDDALMKKVNDFIASL
ncbi:colicin-like pore-forming protein [Erwiniaceae bacterium L1_54_6]|nr:colicin-like pore-forming protein [Erwiniaceae bacterium L1_54_6]